MARAGYEPSFAGGKELTAAMGGTIPPILWDGATSFDVGGETRTEEVRVVFGAPGITMGIDKAGQDRLSGKIGPAMPAAAEIAEPEAIQLPANQPMLDRRDIMVASAD